MIDSLGEEGKQQLGEDEDSDGILDEEISECDDALLGDDNELDYNEEIDDSHHGDSDHGDSDHGDSDHGKCEELSQGLSTPVSAFAT